MPSAIEKLRSKLSERLNWDTFTKELGQGMETLPTPMTVLTPGTIGKFAKELAKNKDFGKRYFKEFPGQIRNALAFMQTRYPTTFNKIFAFEKEMNPNLAGTYNRYKNRISINPSTYVHASPEQAVETLGHELGHNVVSRRYPKTFSNSEIDNLYLQREALENEFGPGTQASYYKEQLANRLKEINDIIYSNPAETIPDKFGRAARKSMNKYYDMWFPK